MMRVIRFVTALIVAPAALTTSASAAERAWDHASAAGTVEAYTKVALEHPELADAARDAIAKADAAEVRTAMATRQTPNASDTPNYFRDMHVI